MTTAHPADQLEALYGRLAEHIDPTERRALADAVKVLRRNVATGAVMFQPIIEIEVTDGRPSGWSATASPRSRPWPPSPHR